MFIDMGLILFACYQFYYDPTISCFIIVYKYCVKDFK